MLRAPASLNSASGPGLHGYYSRSFIRSTKVASALLLPSGHRQLSCPGFGTPRLQGLPHGARVQAELVPAPGEPGPGAGCGSALPPGSFRQSSTEEQGTSSSGGARVGAGSQSRGCQPLPGPPAARGAAPGAGFGLRVSAAARAPSSPGLARGPPAAAL